MRILRKAALTVAGGVAMAFALALFVSAGPPDLCCPVGWVTTKSGGIDLWTGEVRPSTVTVYDLSTGRVVRELYVPENYKDRRAVPVPVSFVAGSLLTLTVLTIVKRRPRRLAPDSIVPAA